MAETGPRLLTLLLGTVLLRPYVDVAQTDIAILAGELMASLPAVAPTP